MSAIEAPPGDQIVSQPLQQKTFAARRGELTLVMKPEYPVRGPSGEQVDLSEGIRIQFTEGQLRISTTGTVMSAQGRSIPARDVLDFLDRHRLNGDRFEGFFEVPQSAPPVTEDELTAITLAVATHDTEKLELVLESERTGWNREPIIKAVEQGLAAIQQMTEQYLANEAAQAEAQERSRKE